MDLLHWIGHDGPDLLRRDLRHSRAPAMRLRRAIVGASLLGTACMAVTTLYQAGVLKHVPEPPLRGFDSDRVNASDTAYGLGMPDSPLGLLAHAVAIAFALRGGADRAERHPWLPIAAAAAAAPAAAVGAKFVFHEMPVKERAWCPWCVVDGLVHLFVFVATLVEARHAVAALANGRGRHRSRSAPFTRS